MSWISATDPLALVAIQGGQIGTPSTEAAAAGANQLDSRQRSTEIGEPVPIVFARRRNDAGGVLISPGATEARFENDTDNDVTAFYHLVLSEGRISPIAVKDVFQGACRVGQHTQTYNRRAGTWTPGNAIVERSGFTKPEASYYCGSVGRYPGMSTLSFKVTIPNGFDQWNRQVHAFIRGGMEVTRLFDNVTGPSDNFADLVRWMLLNSGRLQSSLVDTVNLQATATFLEQNRFRCNCNITESSNYTDLVGKWGPYFMVAESDVAGKRGLRSLLPINSNGTINTGAISPVFTFTEDEIVSGSVEIAYTSLADRRPFVAQMIWRQQPDDDFGIIRTAEVRYAGTAPDGPYESHDLSEFCCTENHAVKAGAYILAKRRYTSHTIRFTARPQANNTVVIGGSIIRVRLARNATTGSIGFHDYLYQVERITKTLAGELSYECVHFPIDSQGRSLVALDVANTTGSGLVLSNNRSGLGCDLNSSTDNTIPTEEFATPGLDEFPAISIGGIGGGSGLEGGSLPDGAVPPGTVVTPNPSDGLGGVDTSKVPEVNVGQAVPDKFVQDLNAAIGATPPYTTQPLDFGAGTYTVVYRVSTSSRKGRLPSNLGGSTGFINSSSTQTYTVTGVSGMGGLYAFGNVIAAGQQTGGGSYIGVDAALGTGPIPGSGRSSIDLGTQGIRYYGIDNSDVLPCPTPYDLNVAVPYACWDEYSPPTLTIISITRTA